MKVLFAGASGFLGQRVLKLLVSQNIDTIVIGRNHFQGVPASNFLSCDLLSTSDFGDLVKSVGATHLLHLAWYAEHGEYWKSHLNLRWVDATVRLTEAFCLAGGKRIVVAGTCAEYDWSYGYCSEANTPLQPATLYGNAKDVTRRLVTAVCKEYQVACAWGRVFMPYGPGEDRRRLIPSLVDVFAGKRAPFGVNASAYRDFLHVDDVASGFFALLKDEAEGAFNISSAQPLLIADVVKWLAKAGKADPEIVLSLNSERQAEPNLLVGENTKLMGIGWRPRHEFCLD